MQATVATYDPATRSGTLLHDDGSRLNFSSRALKAGGPRMLRSGQRVFVVLDDAGAVAELSIWPVTGT